MTKDEIKAIVATKIAGQGSAIDAASVLPTILDAIIDIIPSGSGSNAYIEMVFPQPFTDATAEEAAQHFGITTAEFEKLISGKYSSALVKGFSVSYLVIVDNDGEAVYFFSGDQQGFGCSYYLSYSDGLYSFNEV